MSMAATSPARSRIDLAEVDRAASAFVLAITDPAEVDAAEAFMECIDDAASALRERMAQ